MKHAAASNKKKSSANGNGADHKASTSAGADATSLALQRVLRSRPATDSLPDITAFMDATYGVRMSSPADAPHLCAFKYSQNSAMDDAVVRESRGVVLDSSNRSKWDIVALPFDKFFNAAEPGTTATAIRNAFDWPTVRVYEKLDGTLCFLYYYADAARSGSSGSSAGGRWMVGTTGAAAAGGQTRHANAQLFLREQKQKSAAAPAGVDSKSPPSALAAAATSGGGESDATFAELFWSVFRGCGYRLPTSEDAKGVTFMFELVGPKNRIVVAYDEPALFLLGARRIAPPFQEMLPEYASQLAWSAAADAAPVSAADSKSAPKAVPFRCAPHHAHLKSLADMNRSFGELSAFEHEGYVAVDKHFHRLKVKHPGFVALFHLSNGFNTRNMTEFVRHCHASSHEIDELLSYHPALSESVTAIADAYRRCVKELEQNWTKAGTTVAAAKAFNVKANESKVPECLFALRSGAVKSVAEYLSTLTVTETMKLLGLSDRKEKKSAVTKKKKKKAAAAEAAAVAATLSTAATAPAPSLSPAKAAAIAEAKAAAAAARKKKKAASDDDASDSDGDGDSSDSLPESKAPIIDKSKSAKPKPKPVKRERQQQRSAAARAEAAGATVNSLSAKSKKPAATTVDSSDESDAGSDESDDAGVAVPAAGASARRNAKKAKKKSAKLSAAAAAAPKSKAAPAAVVAAAKAKAKASAKPASESEEDESEDDTPPPKPKPVSKAAVVVAAARDATESDESSSEPESKAKAKPKPKPAKSKAAASSDDSDAESDSGDGKDAKSAPKPAAKPAVSNAEVDVTKLVSFRHGSLSSRDRDVIFVWPHVPTQQIAAKFCAKAKDEKSAASEKEADAGAEDRNVVVIENGRIVWAYKGLIDETNNAVKRTYALHQPATAAACPVQHAMPRDIVTKVNRVVIYVLGSVIHEREQPKFPNLRAEVKKALKSYSLQARSHVLASLDFTALSLDGDALKSIAFQFGQAIALGETGTEWYTKEELCAAFEPLTPFLTRKQNLTANERGAMNRIRDRFVRVISGVRTTKTKSNKSGFFAEFEVVRSDSSGDAKDSKSKSKSKSAPATAAASAPLNAFVTQLLKKQPINMKSF